VTSVVIVGGGIGGLTSALCFHEHGIGCRVFEQATAFRPLGVGINILPHASAELARLGLSDALAAASVVTREAVFYNRFGQLIYKEPLGRYAGYAHPQYSIHRARLHALLHHAVGERLGPAAIVTGAACTHVTQDPGSVTAHFADGSSATGDALVACDGLHSVVRKQLHPGEGPPRYSGVNMWRGVSVWPRVLTGASMIRAGWLATGKMVIYPIADNVDGEGRQLVNWVAEIETPQHATRDWNRRGELRDFIGAFADWHFDWLDVPAMIRAAQSILEFPMVDQEPLPFWSQGRVTLLGDAAHPMYPRGSNGAGQAILDARALADALASQNTVQGALAAYEAVRLPFTANVVRANRTNPPDAILREVWQRTGDRPFSSIDDVVSREELIALSDGYKRVAGMAAPARKEERP
jgi:2-polyprenyl-6-methoxyphenol hydroxylase-like FAD-dependent oxidoreductase